MAGCAHRAGTVPFGADPATSVLDPDCRAQRLADRDEIEVTLIDRNNHHRFSRSSTRSRPCGRATVSSRARPRDKHTTEPPSGTLMHNDRWEWPDELDALTAAPGNHQLLLENDRVRVLLTTIPRGAATPVHTHRWPSVEYVLSTTNFVRRDTDQHVLLDTRAADAEPQSSESSGPTRSRRIRSRTSATRNYA